MLNKKEYSEEFAFLFFFVDSNLYFKKNYLERHSVMKGDSRYPYRHPFHNTCCHSYMFSLTLYVCNFLGHVKTRLNIIQFKNVTVTYIHETNFLDPTGCIFLYYTLFAQFSYNKISSYLCSSSRFTLRN